LIDKEVLNRIAKIFVGDDKEYYHYKKGWELVDFFNENFNYNHKYGFSPENPEIKGFPTRYVYVSDRLEELLKEKRINKFFNIILDENYIMKEQDVSEIQAIEMLNEIFLEYNRLLKTEGYTLTKYQGKYLLEVLDNDLEKIGEGGYAEVYYQKSTGYVVKKLKKEFLNNRGVRSRFKREFELTKSLNNMDGIINVIDFDESRYSYRMEKADCTIEKFIMNNETLDDNKKMWIATKIVDVIAEVHFRNIIHRDLSPNNIFKVGRELKIGDFGLGKNIEVLHSHQTINSLGSGQYLYCAPEQAIQLKEGDKRSDVFSLGRIINFIFNCNPENSDHLLGRISQKAISREPTNRYNDAIEMYESIQKFLRVSKDKNYKKMIFEEIKQEKLIHDVEEFLYGLSGKEICKYLVERREGFFSILQNFMRRDDENALRIMESVESNYQDYIWSIKGSYEDWDPYAEFCYGILNEENPEFSYCVKEIAARILKYVARIICRYSAEDLIQNLIGKDIDPMIEEILK
jgi:hypothetical protein